MGDRELTISMDAQEATAQLELEVDEASKEKAKSRKKALDADKVREEVLDAIATSRLDKLQHRVAWILNHYPRTRDSDVALSIQYWREFQSELLDGEHVKLRDVYRLARFPTLARWRRRLQYDCSLFLASPAVRRARGKLSEEEKERAIEFEPPPPMYTVYADESGKTNDFLVVGALWFLDSRETIEVTRSIEALAKEMGGPEELHFKEIDWGTLDYYRTVADVLVEKAASVSFTALSVDRRGHKRVDDAIADLYRHLLVRGVAHQHASNRAPLPRSLSVFKDQEEVGRDKLLMAQLGEHLREVSRSRFDSKLKVDRMVAKDSRGAIPVQLADLWVSSVSRVLNATGARNSARDEFADHFLGLIGMPEGPTTEERVGDVVVHVAL